MLLLQMALKGSQGSQRGVANSTREVEDLDYLVTVGLVLKVEPSRGIMDEGSEVEGVERSLLIRSKGHFLQRGLHTREKRKRPWYFVCFGT